MFAGFTVLVLGCLGGWPARRRRRTKSGSADQAVTVGDQPGGRPRNRGASRGPPFFFGRFSVQRHRAGLWLLVLLVFFLLALGPVLHIGGQTALLPGGREIPLPYAWLVQVVPFMDISRSVSRFDAVIMLALGVLAAMGANGLVQRGRGGRTGSACRHGADHLRVPAGALSHEPARHAGVVPHAGRRSAAGRGAEPADELGPPRLSALPDRTRQAADRCLHQPRRPAHTDRARTGPAALPAPGPGHHRVRSGSAGPAGAGRPGRALGGARPLQDARRTRARVHGGRGPIDLRRPTAGLPG